MKNKVVLGVIAVITICGLSATPAQAGGGAGVGSIDVFFECQSIAGASVGQLVSTYNLDDSLSHANVSVGNSALKCRQVNVKNSANVFLTPPTSDQLKCYVVNEKGPRPASHIEVLEDAFFSSDPVRVGQPLQYLCSPTIATIP